MRLSTSTNLFIDRRNGERIKRFEAMKRCYNVGYRVIDFNFCDSKGDFDFLSEEDWMTTVLKLNELRSELSIEFSQSHIPFYDMLASSRSDIEMLETMVQRAIIASGVLGVKWAVMHPGTAHSCNWSISESKKQNIEYLSPHLELAKKSNVGIAIENMADFSNSGIARHYCATPEELCDLVDSFNDKSVGVCWDFGHANIMKYDQSLSLKHIGKRLKATHVDDNFGSRDDHLLPFYGTIQWESIMKTLVQIDYKGDFVFEVHGQVKNMPDSLTDLVAKHSIEVGNYLLKLSKAISL